MPEKLLFLIGRDATDVKVDARAIPDFPKMANVTAEKPEEYKSESRAIDGSVRLLHVSLRWGLFSCGF